MIPFEIRQRVGFSYNDVLSFTEAPDGRTVIVKREKICDNCAAEKPQRRDGQAIEYKAWFCGHWHTDKRIDKMHFLFHSFESDEQFKQSMED